jgi:predicted transcriptional regulator
MAREDPKGEWKFLTNHALVLAWLDQHPQSTARETALSIGITERTALKIIGELDSAGYLTRRRKGRRNVYRVIRSTPLQHNVTGDVAIGDLLRVIAPKTKRQADMEEEEEQETGRVRRTRRTA